MIKRKHYVITRFNYGLYKKRTPEAARDWMQGRMQLFEEFTVPSMKSQTEQNFEWVILFDSATDRKYIDKTRYLTRGIHTKIEFVDGNLFVGKKYGEHTSIGGVLSETLRNVVCTEAKTTIQTRLDNDDAYAPDTIRLIQQHFADKRPRETVEFKYGYVYDKQNGVMYEAEHKNGSPWVSILVDGCTLETVYDGVHQKYRNSEQLIGYRSWMMVVHGNNVSNKVLQEMKPVACNVNFALKEMGL